MLNVKWLIGLVVLGTTAVYFIVNKSKRDALLDRVTFRGRKASTSKTPPRSLSPEQSAVSTPSYSDALPPSRREGLANLKEKRPLTATDEVSEAEVRRNILPMTQDYQTANGGLYTPMGFSVDEIKALGDFPDYATLSGVLMPNAYREFDIDKAIPRPYRPFRWNYHQTMCALSISLPSCRAPLMFQVCSSQEVGDRLVDRIGKHLSEANRAAQGPVREVRQDRPPIPARIRTSLQGADGDGRTIHLRALPAILLSPG